MTNQLFITNLVVLTTIGVNDWEQRIRQKVELDIVLNTHSTESDKLEDTIDYDNLCQQLTEFISTTNVRLIETLAEKVAKQILQLTGVSYLRLTLRKPGAIKNATTVGITIERGHNH